MNIQNQKKNSSQKTLIIATVILLIIAISVGAYLLTSQDNQSNTPKDSTQKSADQSKDTSKNSSKVDKKTDDTTVDKGVAEHEKEKDIPPNYEGPDANASESLTGSINYAGVIDGKLTIRTTINQALDSGSCAIALTKGSTTVNRSSNIISNPSSSSCEGFDIPTAELGGGDWSFTIKVTSGNRTGVLKGTAAI